MTKDQVMTRLEELGDEGVRARNIRNGVGENQFGVKMGDLRVIAKEIKSDPELAVELWETGNLDARLLAVLLMKPKKLSAEEVDALVLSVDNAQLADWVNSYVVKVHPEKEALRVKWMQSDDPSQLRSGWSLTAARIEKDPEGLDLGAILDRIEKEMGDAPEMAKWTMNFALAEIGINHPEHRERALAIGEKIGAYRDYPTPKGCTSPFAPLWINEMVSRQG